MERGGGRRRTTEGTYNEPTYSTAIAAQPAIATNPWRFPPPPPPPSSPTVDAAVSAIRKRSNIGTTVTQFTDHNEEHQSEKRRKSAPLRFLLLLLLSPLRTLACQKLIISSLPSSRISWFSRWWGSPVSSSLLKPPPSFTKKKKILIYSYNLLLNGWFQVLLLLLFLLLLSMIVLPWHACEKTIGEQLSGTIECGQVLEKAANPFEISSALLLVVFVSCVLHSFVFHSRAHGLQSLARSLSVT